MVWIPLLEQQGWQLHVLPMLQDNYCWLLLHVETRQCWVVDPGESQPVKQLCAQYQLHLQGIWLTHHHLDHCGGLLGQGALKGRIYGHNLLAQRYLGDLQVQILQDGQVFSCLDLEVLPVATPGHTLDHMCFYIPSMSLLLTGDTLLPAGCGRLMEGTGQAMAASLERLKGFPKATWLAMGHEYTARNLGFAQGILPACKGVLQRQAMLEQGLHPVPAWVRMEQEQASNVFLRCGEPEVMAAVGAADPLSSFMKLRRLRDQYVG